MADRFPLMVNASTNQIQELPSPVNYYYLVIYRTPIDAACGDIVSTGGNDPNFGMICSTTVTNSRRYLVEIPG